MLYDEVLVKCDDETVSMEGRSDWFGKHSAWISTRVFGENPKPPIIKKEVEQH